MLLVLFKSLPKGLLKKGAKTLVRDFANLCLNQKSETNWSSSRARNSFLSVKLAGIPLHHQEQIKRS